MKSTIPARRLALVSPAVQPFGGDAERRRRALDVLSLVRQLVPGIEIAVAAFDPADFGASDDVRIVGAHDAGALIAAAYAANVVVIGDAELATAPDDALATDSLVRHGTSGLAYAASLACIAACSDRPLWVLGASIGDVATERGAELVRAVFELADHATVRDAESRDHLEALGISVAMIGIDPDDYEQWTPEPAAAPSSPLSWRSTTTQALIDEIAPRVRQQLWHRQQELEDEVTARTRAVQDRDAIIRQREEAIATLRSEAARRDADLARRGIAAMEAELTEIKASRAWRTIDRYRGVRARVRARAARKGKVATTIAPAPLREVTEPLRVERAHKHDVVCFSVIDWESRWQRPQQLATKFADNGHRVFYVRMSRFLPIGGPSYELAPLRTNVWAVTLATRMHPRVYEQPINATISDALTHALGVLRSEHDVVQAVSLVQIPTWRPVAELAREQFGWPIVYDCMDEWDGFPGIAQPVIGEEIALAGSADLVTVSAQRLLEKWAKVNGNVVLARNATDFARFADAAGSEELDALKPPLLGYFGAISEWFDLELVAWLARERPAYTFVLIGGADVDVGDLKNLSNVLLLGHRPYEEIPEHLARFDVCLIPFRVNETTAAADQVKFYEYVSRGKPVVSTWLPELEPFREHLYMVTSHDEFLAALDLAVAEDDEGKRNERIALARANDWQARYEVMEEAISEVLPMLSVVVVTYANLELSRQCIESLFANTTQPRFEVIVVDNASQDGTPEYLRSLAATDDRIHVVLNDDNRGFAAAMNQGLELAHGDVLVIMNNDIVVPSSWHTPMLRQLEHSDVGLVVASTNTSGNESRIPVTYHDVEEMEAFAAQRRRDHDGRSFDIRVATMFCVAMRRDVYEAVGPLDEQFGIGMFEDDDYSHRTRLAGFRVVCAEDAFVHHVGQAALNTLSPRELQSLWDENQRRYEDKWSVTWEPHTLRPELRGIEPDE